MGMSLRRILVRRDGALIDGSANGLGKSVPRRVGREDW